MLAASIAGPLARGRLVVVSAWRDVHEGARARLISLPGMCRIDVRPEGDSLSLRLLTEPDVSLHTLPAGEVQAVQIEPEGADGAAARLFDHQHAAFRVVAHERTVDVSLMIGVTQLHHHGVVRVSAQVVMADAD